MTTSHPSHANRPHAPKRLWNAFVNAWRKPKTTTWGEIVTVAAFLAIAGWFIIGQVESIKDREIASAAFEVQQDAYQADLRAYDSSVSAHTLCVDSVGRSDANREQWQLLADIVAALDSGTGRAVALAEEIRTGPVLSVPPRSLEDCPTIPALPEPPTRP
jgi:hypothetical protein